MKSWRFLFCLSDRLLSQTPLHIKVFQDGA